MGNKLSLLAEFKMFQRSMYVPLHISLLKQWILNYRNLKLENKNTLVLPSQRGKLSSQKKKKTYIFLSNFSEHGETRKGTGSHFLFPMLLQ